MNTHVLTWTHETVDQGHGNDQDSNWDRSETYRIQCKQRIRFGVCVNSHDKLESVNFA